MMEPHTNAIDRSVFASINPEEFTSAAEPVPLTSIVGTLESVLAPFSNPR
jgi:hypothetical protein